MPVISVGNITVGGAGKTPHVEYLVRLLQDRVRVAVLSRGYKRRTKGYFLAGANVTAREIGDEPYQMYSKYGKNIYVAVNANRCEGIDRLRYDKATSDTDVVLLDDETKEIAKEIVFHDALDRVFIATDYFDASINRISAWTVGLRNVQKALLMALLTPDMTSLQDSNNFTELMVKAEELKTMPFGDVWAEYCKECGAPLDGEWFDTVKNYETEILAKRG